MNALVGFLTENCCGGRMKPSACYDRMVDVMEELFKFTLLMRGCSDYLLDRYSERNERQAKAITKLVQKI